MKYPFLILLALALAPFALVAQVRNPALRRSTGSTMANDNPNITYDRNGRPINKQPGSDSLQKRDRFADSITIYYRYFDSTRNRILDSSINDFYNRFPLDWTYNHLGNYGTAARSWVFNPLMKAGWDAGFHQFDAYQFNLQNTRFFQTTRPFTELGYLLGSKSEQIIDIIHTQNKKSNFNFSFEYRFSNSPGPLKTQNASHNNLRFTAHYVSKRKRYEAFLVLISNKAAASENGGLVNPKKIDSLNFGNTYELETRLGLAGASFRNPFNTTVNTGNVYKNSSFLFRHQYDLGKKDSIMTDSGSIKIFYPRFRLQHNIIVNRYDYHFYDIHADSASYAKYFGYKISNDSIEWRDTWRDFTSQFALITFPDKNNQSQFFKLGLTYQNIFGRFYQKTSNTYYNISAEAEYRNRTRNDIWDIEAAGQLFLNGLNAGDYTAKATLKRKIGKKAGYLTLHFQNVNRSPSFIFNTATSFRVNGAGGFNKENNTRLFAEYINPAKSFTVRGSYYLISNYMYFDSFFNARQSAALFNVLHINAEKKIKLHKHWNLYSEIHVQQTTANAPVNLPLVLLRNRLAFEGNFYTNLFLSTGLEFRFATPFKADGYSPFNGNFYLQQTTNLYNRADMHAFLHFRIKSFKGFIRAENLNAILPTSNALSNKFNFHAPLYPNTGFWFRLGIWWNFVN